MNGNTSFVVLLLALFAYSHIPSIAVNARISVITKDIEVPRSDIIDEIFTGRKIPEEELQEDPRLIDYERKREDIIEEEELLVTGSHVQLTDKEKQVNQLFMRQKLLELSHGFKNPTQNAPGMNFFKAKHLIDSSTVFKFIKEMPKGAILHAHNTAAVSSDWVIGNLSYMPGMLRCVNTDGVYVFTFRRDRQKHLCRTVYTELKTERSHAKNLKRYDAILEKWINLRTDIPEIEYNTIDKVWHRFERMFDTIGDALKYVPAFKAFHWRLMEEMHEDNVLYGEIRTNFKKIYDQNGNDVSVEDSIQILIDLVDEFKRLHPDFLGIKMIYSTHRGSDKQNLRSTFETFKRLHQQFPEFIVGFDLVGQEDKGRALHSFVEILQDLPRTAKYFFHAGETNWYGAQTDLNLLDAILMNTTRIGHGFALMKHPVLSKAVKERDIGIEVSPISNQVLNLVWDLRNHPGGYFMSQNIPMVISNDDPGFWDAKGLSYDFYYSIMSFAPSNAGIKTLKHLVWSSIKYSAMSEMGKTMAYEKLKQEWNKFIDRVLRGDVI